MRYLLKTYLRSGLAALCLGLALVATGCGSSDETSSAEQEARQRVALEAQQAAVQRRHREARRIAVQERRAAARRRAQRAAARERSQAAAREEAETVESEEAESSECDPNYSGACLDPYASDYDCEGGSGNGPDYTGFVVVVGNDHYGLDADGDHRGCE